MKENVDFASVSGYLSGIPVNMEMMEHLYEDLPLFDDERISSIANIATMLAKHILLENILTPDNNVILWQTTEYIDKHLGEDLSIEQITKRLNVCRSVIYKNFMVRFGCTPGEYIKQKRIEKAKEYLLDSALSVEEISQKVGFSSGAYFSSVFKNLVGTSPLNFRKTNSAAR